MSGELFKAIAGVDIVQVAYKGSGGARAGVLGGQVDMMFDAVTTMSDPVRAGKVRALHVGGHALRGAAWRSHHRRDRRARV